MQTIKQDSYAHLKEQLESWKEIQPTRPVNTLPDQRFLITARETLLPELEKLASILEDAGLECGVFRGDDDDPAVGIYVDTFHAVLRLLPADNPACVRAVIAGGSRPNDDLEWFIPYHHIHNGGLDRELQAVMLRLLKRSHGL